MKKIALVLTILTFMCQYLMSYELLTTVEGYEYVALKLEDKGDGFLYSDLINGDKIKFPLKFVESIKTRKYIDILTASDTYYQGEIYSFDEKTVEIGLAGYGSTTIFRDKIEKAVPIDYYTIKRYLGVDENDVIENKFTTEKKIENIELENFNNTKDIYHALGLTLGTPSFLNFVAAGYFNNFLVKADFGLFAIDDLMVGSSLNFGYAFVEEYKLSLAAISKFFYRYESDYAERFGLGFGVEFNFNGFYIEAGPAIYQDDRNHDIYDDHDIELGFIFQIGYVYRFNKIR